MRSRCILSRVCFLVTPLLSLFFLFFAKSSWASPPRHSVFAYGGIGSPTPLPEILRLRGVSLTQDAIAVVGYSYLLTPEKKSFLHETEFSIATHPERAGRYSANAAWVIRWTTPPWGGLLPTTLAIGNGLSYANSIPALEQRLLDKTSRVLYHLLFELTFGLEGIGSPLRNTQLIFRIHHRSGIFGVIDGITGGSDFLCLGLKMSW